MDVTAGVLLADGTAHSLVTGVDDHSSKTSADSQRRSMAHVASIGVGKVVDVILDISERFSQG